LAAENTITDKIPSVTSDNSARRARNLAITPTPWADHEAAVNVGIALEVLGMVRALMFPRPNPPAPPRRA